MLLHPQFYSATMKKAPYRFLRRFAQLSLGAGLLLGGMAQAQIVTLVDCTAGDPIGYDQISRGFYVSNYPGSSINGVTVWMRTQSATTHQYQVSLTVTEGTYDGPVVASWHANASLNSTAKPVSIQMISPPPQRENPPVTPGSRLCFKFGLNAKPEAPLVFYGVKGSIGENLPDATDPCPDIVQTNGTNPPLSSFRREGVQLRITGNKFLNVSPGQSIQMAIDGANAGDTVTVRPGTYTENLTLRTGVNVQGNGADDTFLRGTGTGSVVTATNVTNVEFSGFTVRGSGTNGGDAGFLIANSSVLLKGNTITGNANGIRTANSNSFICGNLITGNGNPANIGIDFGVRCSGNDLFAGNRIVDNLEGGVLCVTANCTARFLNNTVSNNPSRGFQAAGSATPTLMNSIISGNGGSGLFAETSAVLTSNYNCLFGNTPRPSTIISGGSITGGVGNIAVDPQLDASQPGAYALAVGSPCIDAGNPAALYNDLDGSRNDMGATGGACGSETPPGSIVSGFVWTSVGSIPTSEIRRTGLKRGLTNDRDRPFGGRPWLFGAFGSTNTAVTRYSVSIAKWTGNTPPLPRAFEYVSQPLSKVRYDITGGTLSTSNVSLGPVQVGGRPTYTLTRNNGNIFWAHENLRVILDTPSLSNGTYSVRMQGYNFLGVPVSLTVNQDLILHVNNTRPVVSIDAVSFGGGAPFDECSIINLPSPTSTLNFRYTANHPDGFLDNFALTALVGRNRSGGNIVSGSYVTNGTGQWVGFSNEPVAATPANPEPALPALQQWETCAYQFRLTAWARTTNGFGRIYHATFFDNYALDLRPARKCSPDLDGDGDVDGDDLAILAAAFGTAP